MDGRWSSRDENHHGRWSSRDQNRTAKTMDRPNRHRTGIRPEIVIGSSAPTHPYLGLGPHQRARGQRRGQGAGASLGAVDRARAGPERGQSGARGWGQGRGQPRGRPGARNRARTRNFTGRNMAHNALIYHDIISLYYVRIASIMRIGYVNIQRVLRSSSSVYSDSREIARIGRSMA